MSEEISCWHCEETFSQDPPVISNVCENCETPIGYPLVDFYQSFGENKHRWHHLCLLCYHRPLQKCVEYDIVYDVTYDNLDDSSSIPQQSDDESIYDAEFYDSEDD